MVQKNKKLPIFDLNFFKHSEHSLKCGFTRSLSIQTRVKNGVIINCCFINAKEQKPDFSNKNAKVSLKIYINYINTNAYT